MKNKKIMIGGMLSLVLLLGFVIAFSPGCQYSLSNPLNVYPGEDKQVDYHLSASADYNGTSMVKAEIISGGEIARIADSNNVYEVSQSKTGMAHIDVKVPSDAPIGSEYTVRLRFSDVTPSTGSGMVGFAVQYEGAFKVVVVEKSATPALETPASEGISAIWWILGIIVVIAIIAIIWFVVKSKKK